MAASYMYLFIYIHIYLLARSVSGQGLADRQQIPTAGNNFSLSGYVQTTSETRSTCPKA